MSGQNSGYQFVELNRTFHDLSAHASENDDVDLIRTLRVGKRLGWSDLIQEYRTVILSEAGSGKTTEMRNAARNLCRKGLPAFFLRLEHIPTDFEDAFEVGSFEEFQQWLASDEEGWLLLDSVDEARLRNPGDFELAIRKLGRRIVVARDRAHIILTGRTAAWRPKTDLEFCTQHLPYTPPTTTIEDREQPEESLQDQGLRTTEKERAQESEFRVSALDDLSADQIERFAEARGVTDAKMLLEAVERADAWSFTSRPQDLEELIEFWIDQKKIGSRLELMQNSIDRRLAERDQVRANARPLSSQAAREGARLVAAATTLAHEPTICVPDGARAATAISVRDVFPGWDERDQATLLSRPIFDEAIYGTVRFHHRTVREYLTAEWLSDLLARETSRRKIEALLFRNQYGLEVAVPTMRPILPWLALLDDKVRERLRSVAPEVLFEGGDPSRLPFETRRTILYEVCEQLASGASRWSATDYDAVQRFSNADLAEDIRRLFRKYGGNDELAGFLLRMVWLGELRPALPEAKAVALSASASKYTRIAAFRAVKAIGSDKDHKDIREAFLSESAELQREWLAELIAETEPSADTLPWVLDCLARSEAKERFATDRLADAVAEFSRALDPSLLPQFVSGLNKLLDQPPIFKRRHCEISQRFAWLAGPAAQAVQRLVRECHRASLEPDALGILHKLPIARSYATAEPPDRDFEFSNLVPKWSELNRRLFWYEVEEARKTRNKKRGERIDEFWRVSASGSFWRFSTNDFEYVVGQITEQTLGDNRLVALSLAFRLYIENGRLRKWREKLKAKVAGDAELSTRLAKYLRPPPQRKEERDEKRREADWRRRAEARREREEANRQDWKTFLSANIKKLRDPGLAEPEQISQAQHYLHERMREKRETSGRWTEGNWRVLIGDQDEAVARAFRDGVVAYWRRYQPKLKSEGAEQNCTPFGAIFGLTGLSIEAAEVADWCDRLSESEVEIAFRYASHELNGFPSWFPKLFERFPDLVGGLLLDEIEFELSLADPIHYILDDVSWSGEWAWDEIAPSVIRLLEAAEPKSLASLDKLLTIVQGSAVSDDRIRTLASEKCRTLRRASHLALWHAVWTGVDPGAAIPSLIARINGMATKQERTSAAMEYVVHLWGGRGYGPARVRQAFQIPQHLKTLYLLMHEHIRRQDDVDRSGTGAYAPDLRDRAQEARNGLFTLLNEIPGKDAFLALGEISEAHPEESSRPWFRLHAKEKAERDADIEPWSASQVSDFHTKLECTPANHRDLAELAIMRVLDLKDDLETGDSSIASILRDVKQETKIRKYIGRELREKAFSRYTIPQEEELADGKQPDLRFHGNGFDGPVPAELKLADNWSGPDLFDGLESQLCGDYLRDNRSSRGLFILVYRGETKGWDIPSSANRVGFDELVRALERHWGSISPKYAGVEDIKVIGIDLTCR